MTALAWNPVHGDLFAVGYGDFKSIGMSYGGGGAVALHSLLQPYRPYGKNIVLSAGVLCLEFHSQNAHLLTIGCSNGSIHICDCRESTLVAYATVGPLLGAAVTRIRWLENSFLASSMNGQVTEWMLNSNLSTGISLELVDSCSLTTPSRPLASLDLPPDGLSHQFLGNFPAPILYFDIDQFKNSLIIGYQDGSIVEVSIPSLHHRHASSWNGHDGPVVSVACRGASLAEAGMNTSAHIAILTASADWTARLWDATAAGQMEESETFDLGAPVADVAWSPACSTIFGAVTESGIVHIYDMANDVRTALCTQRIVSSKVNLTRLAFNPQHHGIMIVGDGRGCVHCFKLSPNLRGCNNDGVATESRQGLRTLVTRRKRSAGKTESKDKSLDDTSALASHVVMEPLLQVLGKAHLRREVVTTLST